MMLPTHVVIGLALGAPLLVIAPEIAPVALLGVLIGSILPDLDMYSGHRRTLHYPTGYAIATAMSIPLAVWLQWPIAISGTFVLFGAALHCRMDRYGGGLELEPWKATSNRAVYDHVQRQWLTPKRWIRYDGAPEDFILMATIGLPLVFVFDGGFQWVTFIAIVVGGAYAVFRRRLAGIARTVFRHVPASVAHHVPARYLE